MEEETAKKQWPKREKPTAERIAEAKVLERLRFGVDDLPPPVMPLACIVKVVACEDVPLANDKYAMASIYGPDEEIFRLCVARDLAAPGMDMLYVDAAAALPIEERWKDERTTHIKEKVYRFGFGVKVRRYLVHVKRNIFTHNCGVLYRLDAFANDLEGAKIGEDCSSRLNIENHNELKARQNAPSKPKKQANRKFWQAPVRRA